MQPQKNFAAPVGRGLAIMENVPCPKIYSTYLQMMKIYSTLGNLSTLIQNMILIIQTSMILLSNLATSLTNTHRIGPLHPPTHTGHKLLKKLDQNRTAYTVPQKPFIRFPHLPNRGSSEPPPPIAWTTTVRLIIM